MEKLTTHTLDELVELWEVRARVCREYAAEIAERDRSFSAGVVRVADALDTCVAELSAIMNVARGESSDTPLARSIPMVDRHE